MSTFLKEYENLFSSTTHQGASATVYKVRHKALGYIRAVRMLNQPIVNENDKKYQKFLEECKLLLRLGNGGHPNIVRINQPRLLENQALVEMEWIEGEDLYDYITKKCKNFVPINEVIEFVKNISSALAYCHHDIYKFCINKDEDMCVQDGDDGKNYISPNCEKDLIEKYKVIHNDIHSKNVIKKYDGSYILLDFGLAIKSDTVVKSSTRDGGAPEYKAPEKWDDDTKLTEHCDVYSFGILMYEMLAGEVPFILENKRSINAEYELGQKHKNTVPASIENIRKEKFQKTFPNKQWHKDYPNWLEDIIMKCLAKKPSDRYKNAKELHNAILKNINEDNLLEGQEDRLKVKQLQKDFKDLEILLGKTKLDNLDRIALYAKEIKEKEKVIEELEKGGASDDTEMIKQLKQDKKVLESKISMKENKIVELQELNIRREAEFSSKLKIKDEEIGSFKNKKTNNSKPNALVILCSLIALSAMGYYTYTVTPDNNSNKVSKVQIQNPLPTSPQDDSTATTKNFQYTNAEFNLYGEKFKFSGIGNSQFPINGTATFPDGKIYTGDFVDGYRTGKGKVTWADGDYYDGDFNKNELEGDGVMHYNDNTYSKGVFKKSKFINGYFFNGKGDSSKVNPLTKGRWEQKL